ncbi:hypothetical protein ACFVVU_36100 [Kitasatospora sp. NPDC057965]|uniref:hypothetical protein n=1 Tax=Kitasatospora sp. NPDC057965 TaxID=3346291 RepID=UPI0036DCCF4D
MPKPRSTRLLCIVSTSRAGRMPAGVRRRLVVVTVLLAAASALAVGVDVATVVEAVTLPAAAVKLADLTTGAGPVRRRHRGRRAGR